MHTLYNLLIACIKPVIPLFIRYRITLGQEDTLRYTERFGIPSQQRPNTFLIWCHAVSIGESLSILGLIKKILNLNSHITILVTTTTVSAAQLMTQRLPKQAIHQYMPFDVPAYMTRFVQHWKPNLVLWVESELWPNILSLLHQKHIKTILINARMSPRTFKKWSRFPSTVKKLVSVFELCLTQTAQDVQLWQKLGITDVRYLGNLKYSSDPLPYIQEDFNRIQQACQDRPLWLFASSHKQEEESIIRTHLGLQPSFPNLLTIVAPRHPDRGPHLATLAKQYHLTVSLRSTGNLPQKTDSLYIADTIGEMGLWYRLTRIVFIGGSLFPHGGQNPIEPAQLHCTILFGPSMFNFSHIVQEFCQNQAALQLPSDHNVLVQTIAHLLKDKQTCQRFADAAYKITLTHRQVINHIVDVLQPLIDKESHKNLSSHREYNIPSPINPS